MQAFEKLFDGVTFKKGTEVAFATHHKGQLVTQIDGKQVRRAEQVDQHEAVVWSLTCGVGFMNAAHNHRPTLSAASVLAAAGRLAPSSLPPWSRRCLISTWALTPSAAMQSGRSARAWQLC